MGGKSWSTRWPSTHLSNPPRERKLPDLAPALTLPCLVSCCTSAPQGGGEAPILPGGRSPQFSLSRAGCHGAQCPAPTSCQALHGQARTWWPPQPKKILPEIQRHPRTPRPGRARGCTWLGAAAARHSFSHRGAPQASRGRDAASPGQTASSSEHPACGGAVGEMAVSGGRGRGQRVTIQSGC